MELGLHSKTSTVHATLYNERNELSMLASMLIAVRERDPSHPIQDHASETETIIRFVRFSWDSIPQEYVNFDAWSHLIARLN